MSKKQTQEIEKLVKSKRGETQAKLKKDLERAESIEDRADKIRP